MVFPDGEPQERYDFISTFDHGAEEALQKELKDQVGYVGRRETREADVLKLRLRRANAPGLKPPISGGGGDWMGAGRYYCDDRPLSTEYPEPAEGLTKFLEVYFGTPVIDETGLTQHFQIDLRWTERGARDPNHELLKRALLDQLGLELVVDRAPVEMLVLARAK